MFEPVSDENRLAVGSFNQVLQHFQLSAVNGPCFTILVIHSAVAHLQEFIGQGGSIGSIDISILQRDNQIMLELVIQLSLRFRHLHLMAHIDALRYIQIIQCFHRDRHVGDLLVDLFFRSRAGNVGEHHACRWVHRTRLKICVPIPTDETAQPLPAVQDTDLCPQIHKAIGCRCAGQSDPAFYKRAYFPQPFKPL